MPQELPPQYNPKDIEEKWFEFWAKTPLFHAHVRPDKESFCIVIPPPNVTGILHMGHALNNTIQDILIRTRRMQGFEALWMPGTDHAGIATQNVVERQLAKEGLRRQDLGREEFLKRVWQWKKEYGSTIIHQLKRMGATCDWQRERFTMDEEYSAAVVEVFVGLYEKGLIYRGDYIINWCPRCQTALSDEEAPHHDLEGKLYYIKYPLKKSSVIPSTPLRASSHQSSGKRTKSIDHRLWTMDYVVVATTRPETMLGDTAVAVNPTDKKYKHLVGETLILPLRNREIKIIADKLVDKKFGTGAVKVTPAHDPNDYLIGKEHKLDFINIMNPDGILNTNAGEYADMDRFEAREAIIEDLKERKLLVKIEPHRHAVGHCYRCHTIIEPYLSKQWFVNMKPLSRAGMRAVKKGEIKFYPKRWTKVYLNWMENIKDWCISRQIWWGHRLPVYYCQDCLKQASESSVIRHPSSVKKSKTIDHRPSTIDQKGVIVSLTKPDRCPHCGNADLEQDPDVLDTWFSSWLWPFATFGWPFQSSAISHQSSEKDNLTTEDRRLKTDLEYFYPTSVLVTAPEIIFFWVARMIMAGCEFMGKIPFRDVYIHGTVRDVEGKKMSKSLGNSIDPLSIIDRYGADALRFSLIAIAASGSDIFLSEERFEQGRNFANKIWNASRFILMNLKEGVSGENIDTNNLKIQDQWILSSLNETIRKATKAIDVFKLNEAVNLIYEFFWHKFCDWYVEIAKGTIHEANTQEVLLYVLKKTLLLLHPFMPFITDEISSRLPGGISETIACAAWPTIKKEFDNKAAVSAMDLVFKAVFVLRNFRKELNLGPQKTVSIEIKTTTQKEEAVEAASVCMSHLAFVKVNISTEEAVVPNCLSALIDKDVHLYLPLEGLVDIEKEKQRIEKQIKNAGHQIKQKEKMLKNKDFVKKAPEAVVSRERQRLTELKEALERLKEVRSAFK